MLVVVTGVPGVDKSTVMDSVAETRGFKVANLGTEMFRVAQAKGLVKDRDEMRKLSPQVQREIQIGAAMAYASLTGATVKIVMNHDKAVEAAVEDLAMAVDGYR